MSSTIRSPSPNVRPGCELLGTVLASVGFNPARFCVPAPTALILQRRTKRVEQEAARVLSEELPGVKLTLSSALGRIGLIERENAAIMNSALLAWMIRSRVVVDTVPPLASSPLTVLERSF